MSDRSKGSAEGASLDDLPALVARLGADLVDLIDSKLNLLAVEIKEDATAYVRGGLAYLVGGVVAVIGFALCNVAAALLVAQALASTALDAPMRYAMGFAILGTVYLVGGYVLAKRAERRLAGLQPSTAATVRELQTVGHRGE